MTSVARWVKRWRNSLVYSATILVASVVLEWAMKR